MWTPSEMGSTVAGELGVTITPITFSTVIGWLTNFAMLVLVVMLLVLFAQICCAVLYRMTGMEIFALFLPKVIRREGGRKVQEGDEVHLTEIGQIAGRCLSGFAAILIAPVAIAVILSLIQAISKAAGA